MLILDDVPESHVSIEDEYVNTEHYTDSKSNNCHVQTPAVYIAENVSCPINEGICDEELLQNGSSIIRTIFWVIATSHGIWQVNNRLLDILSQ